MTETMIRTVYAILVEHAGATPSEHMIDAFVRLWPKCREWRFGGLLGCGGKVIEQNGRVYVTCYREHETPEHLAIIENVNARIAALQGQASS